MIWFIKKGDTYKLDLCNDVISITETVSSEAFSANKIYINLRFWIQRIGFSPNVYDEDDNDFHKILFLEKSKGTYFE